MQLPVTFSFRLVLKWSGTISKADLGFRSISGLAGIIDNGVGSIKDASHSAAAAITYDTLVLRRAVMQIDDSPLSQWVFSWLYKQPTTPPDDDVFIDLLDDHQQPYMSWKINGVTPRGWKLDELNAEKDEVLFETIELAYTSLTFVSKLPPKPAKPGDKGDPGKIVRA